MEASGSKQNGAYSGVNDDRLSDLPDCLLLTILSLLKARQVVQTCVLSRRWRRLWLDVPFLDIHSREFPVNYPSCCWISWEVFLHHLRREKALRAEVFRRLEDFVDNLLLHHSTRLLPLQSLRLHINNDDMTDTCIPRWIRRGLSCAPVVLVIRHGVSFMLPPPSASGSATRHLKKLCLDQVTLHRGFDDQQITAGLPVLEDLRFRNTDLSTLSRIKSGTLKNLTLDCCQNTCTSLAIAAPRLTSLHLSLLFYNRAGFIVAEAPSLAEASIRLVKKPKQKPCHWELGSKPDMSMLRDLSKLLGSLFNSNLSSLKLKGFPELLVGENDVAFPVPHKDGIPEAKQPIWNIMKSDKFVLWPMLYWILEEDRHRLRNLRTLILDDCEAGDKMQVLWCFLHNTPVLEKLTLNNCKFSDGVVLGKSRLKSLSSNILVIPPGLRLLEIRYSDKDDHELRHEGIRPIDEVMSMIREKTACDYHDSSYQSSKKERSELEASLLV